jgi:flagellar hook-length control protein FliK
MNTATVICDNTPTVGLSQAGNRAKGGLEPTGDEPQQRFADVLPLAQAAMEQTSDRGLEDKAPVKGRAAKGEAASESSENADRPARRRGETTSVGAQVTAWSFAGIVQPRMIHRQTGSGSGQVQTVTAAAGQPVAEPTTSRRVQKALEQTSPVQGVVAAGPVPARTQQPTQKTQGGQPSSAAEQPVMAQPVAATASKGAASQGQEIASSAVAVTVRTQVAVTTQQAPQETGTASADPAAQAAGGGARVGRSDVRTEQVQAAAVPGVVSPTSQGNTKPDAPTSVKTTAGGQSVVATEKAGQTSAKTQSTNSQQTAGSDAPAKSEKNASDPMPAVDGRPENTTKPAAAVRSDSSKGESARPEARDAATPGVKDAGAAMAEFRVTPNGESVTTVQHASAGTQSQTSVDASAARTPVQSVGEQILDSIRSSGTTGDREVFVRLTPPELGTVLVRFQEQGEHLVGTLEVSTREVQREIEEALPQMVRSLQEAGIQVRRVEVVTSDQPERNLGGEHQPQDVWQQHQGAGQGREHSSASPQTRWSQGMGEQSTARKEASGEESQTAVASGRIDVLL